MKYDEGENGNRRQDLFEFLVESAGRTELDNILKSGEATARPFAISDAAQVAQMTTGRGT